VQPTLKKTRSSNQARWKQTFYIKNVVKDLTFATYDQKSWKKVWWGVKRGNIQSFCVFLSLPVITHELNQSCSTGVL